MESAGSSAVLILEIAIAVVVFVFWFEMLLDCSVEEPATDEKILWVALIFFGQIFGAMIYYFKRRRPRYAGTRHSAA